MTRRQQIRRSIADFVLDSVKVRIPCAQRRCSSQKCELGASPHFPFPFLPLWSTVDTPPFVFFLLSLFKGGARNLMLEEQREAMARPRGGAIFFCALAKNNVDLYLGGVDT